MASEPLPAALEQIAQRIHLLRGHRVMLDRDLAQLYGIPTKQLVQAVRRNAERFPEDFMFQLEEQEVAILRSQYVTSSWGPATAPGHADVQGWGGRRYPPHAFTEQGVAMLSSVLRSPRAVAVNIEIMRAFVRMRQLLAGQEDLWRKVLLLEKKYDRQFREVFDAIRALMDPPEPARRPLGFRPSRQGRD